MTETMTAPEAAELLGLSAWTVYDLVRRREVPHIRIGRRILFRQASLLAWMTEREAASMGEPEPVPGGIRRLK